MEDNEIKIVEEKSEIANNQLAIPEAINPIAPVVPAPKISELSEANTFTDVVDKAKVDIVTEAAATDEKFVAEVKDTLKKATLKRAKVEDKKAALEGQNIDYHAELLETQQELNEYKQVENKWANRERRREFHYNGVKPVMLFVNIDSPMNIPLLYFLTLLLLPFYLLGKLLRGTIGMLISGASNTERSKQVRGLLWTLLALICLGATALIVYLTLGWVGII